MRKLNDGTPIPFKRGIVWYADGSRRSFVTVEQFEALPSDDVVLIQLLYDKEYKGKYLQEVLRGNDYYFEHAGDFYNRQARDIPREVPQERIKRGVLIDDLEFIQAYNAACDGVRTQEG